MKDKNSNSFIDTILDWDCILGKQIAKLLKYTPITANQVTFFTLIMAALGAMLFINKETAFLGSLFFFIARFFDMVDGALARLKNNCTTFGYLFDICTGMVSFVLLYIFIGIGFNQKYFVIYSVLAVFAVLPRLLKIASNISGKKIRKESEEDLPFGSRGRIIADEQGGLPYYTLPIFAYFDASIYWIFVSAAGNAIYTFWLFKKRGIN